jgi:hypothetical protein
VDNVDIIKKRSKSINSKKMDLEKFREYKEETFSGMTIVEAQNQEPLISAIYKKEARLVDEAIHQANDMIEEDNNVSDCCNANILPGGFCSGCKDNI